MNSKDWQNKLSEKFGSFSKFNEQFKDINRYSKPNPNYLENSMINSSELMENIKEFNAEKVKKEYEAIERDKKQTSYLENISKNTDFIVNQFKNTAINLEILNTVLENKNIKLEYIRKDVEENKNVQFEIYELLAKESISNEKERLETTEKLLTQLKDPLKSIDVSASITTIISLILNLMS